MNETFNTRRFGLLVRRQWAENKKVYLLLWGVISLTTLIFPVFSEKSDLFLLQLLLLCFGGCIIISTAFTRWTDIGRSSFYMLLPASSSEKFMCALLYSIILFIPVYCLNYFIIRYVVFYFVILLFPNNLLPFSSVLRGGITSITSAPFSFYLVVFLAFLFAQSLYLVITVFFKKRHMLIFLLTIMLVLIIYNAGMDYYMSAIAGVPRGTVFIPGFVLTFLSPDFGYSPTGSMASMEHFSFARPVWLLNNLAWLVVFCLMYLTAFFRLKEKEL